MTTQSIPRVPLGLGLAGLLPFWGLATCLGAEKIWPGRLELDVLGIGRLAVEHGRIAMALAAYAALIISFLGGIRWGLAVASSRSSVAAPYVLSVMPSLVAWGLLALPEPWSLAGLGGVALILGPVDRRLVSDGLAPPWFGRLRLVLSGGAGTALLLAALAY